MSLLEAPSPDIHSHPSALPADFRIHDVSNQPPAAPLAEQGSNPLADSLGGLEKPTPIVFKYQNIGFVALNQALPLPAWINTRLLPHRTWADGKKDTPLTLGGDDSLRYPDLDAPSPLNLLPGYQITPYTKKISKIPGYEPPMPKLAPEPAPNNPWGLKVPDYLPTARANQSKPKIERPVIYTQSLSAEDRDSTPEFDIVKIDNSHPNYTKTHKRVSQRFDPPLSAKPPQSSHITTAPTYGSERVFIPTYIHSKEHVGAPSDKKITADDLKQAPASGLRDRFVSWLEARGNGSRQEADEVAAAPKVTRTEKRSLKAANHAQNSLDKAAEARDKAKAGYKDFDIAQQAHNTWKEQDGLSRRKIDRADRRLGRQMGKVAKQSRKAEHMTIEAQGKRALLEGEHAVNYDEKLDTLIAAAETSQESHDARARSVEKILADNPKLNTEYEAIMGEITADDSMESVAWENIKNLAVERGLSSAQINALSSQYSADAMVQTMFDAEQRLLDQDMLVARAASETVLRPATATVENKPAEPQPLTPEGQKFYGQMIDRLLESEGSSDAHEDYVKLVVNRLMKEPALSHEYDLAKAEIEADGSPRMRIWQNLREAAQARGLSPDDLNKLARRESADIVTKALKTAEARMAAKWGKPSN